MSQITNTNELLTLSGNSGSIVTPLGNNIQVLGAGAATTSGAGHILTITVPASGGIPWSTVAVNTGMLTNHGYITAAAAQINMALPGGSAGDVIEIVDAGDAGSNSPFRVIQAAGQQIFAPGGQQTTLGAGGYVEVVGGTTNAKYSSIKLRCITANTWVVQAANANLNFV